MKPYLLWLRFAVLLGMMLSLLLTAWIYYPGIYGPGLLDDFSSLLGLEQLAASPDRAWDFVTGDTSGPLGRGVAMATFIAERLLGYENLAASKWVNITLHLANGVCMALLLGLLMKPLATPRTGAAAALLATLWMLAPLHVSTVLYVVQRMAILAMLFSQLSLICYLLWRTSVGRVSFAYFWLALGIAFLVAGVFAKENALVVIPMVLLLEAGWLQGRGRTGQTIPLLKLAAYTLIFFGALAVIVFLLVEWNDLAGRYAFRDFSLEQRLLTQTRILWDYVGQFFLPDVHRMGIYHDDVKVSHSLSSPPSTLWAVFAWVMVLCCCAALWIFEAGRRFATGILVFMTGHSLESTVWPLELYFEHRNYLPSFGLIVALASVYVPLAKRWREVASPLLFWIACWAVYFGFLTSSQVQVWSNGAILAMQTVNAHPESARANRDLATQFAILGGRELAIDYSTAAYFSSLKYAAAGDEHYSDYLLRNVGLACIARDPLTETEYQDIGRFDADRPFGTVATMSVVVKLRQDNICPEFDWVGFQDHLAEIYLVRFDTSQASANMFVALAMLANAAQRWSEAYAYMQRALTLMPGDTQSMLMQLHFSWALGKSLEANSWIDRLQKLDANGKLTHGERATLALYLEDPD